MTPESILEFEAACQKTLAEMKESRSTFPDNSWTDGFFQGANSYHSHLLGVLATLRDSKEVKVPSVFDEIEAELLRAEAKFPDQHLPNFPERMDWDHATAERDQAQELTDRCHAKGVVTWWHVLREEVYEAFAESDPAKLRAELIQVGAMAVRWIEDLDRAIAVVVSEIEKAPAVLVPENGASE